jgi:hypothetical protein
VGIKRFLFSAHNRDLVVILITIYFFSFAVYQVSSVVFDVDITSTEQDNQKILFSILSGVVGINVYVTAWVYRTASDRLAAVDVLVSDIYAICRGFVAVGAVDELVSSFETGCNPALTDLPEGGGFVPPISSLGFLSTDSIHRIIGFYVSLQILRERTKSLSTSRSEANAKNSTDEISMNRKNISSLLYCYFITCENARIAMHRILGLNDADPFYINCMLTCFITDIKCLWFLYSRAMEHQLISAYLNFRIKQRLAPEPSPLNDPEECYAFPPYRKALLVYLEGCKNTEEPEFYNTVKSLMII